MISLDRIPETGPPAGDSYDTLDYGLFEPFGLKQWSEVPGVEWFE